MLASEKPRVFNGRYIQKKQLSAGKIESKLGSFGIVYICQDKITKEYVAMKVEKDGTDMLSLEREIQILEELRGISGVPKLHWYGQEGNVNCMAMQLLGRDLAYQLKKVKKFSLKTICNLADQLIPIIEEVHKRGVIHRDIKPENILTGRDDENTKIYLVDFGISKKYKNNGNHIPFQEHKPFMGTTRYASLAAHLGYELSRRDDLESLGYVFIFLFKGSLPWQNINTNNDKEKTKMVGKLKKEIEIKDLCKGLPIEFMRYMDYVQKLKFNTQPDYKYLQNLFQKIGQNNGFHMDRKFDWIDGTSSTKSSDPQVPKESLNDLGSDYLKRSEFKGGSRRKSAIDSQFSNGQSSIMLNYVPSIVHNQHLGFKRDKQTILSKSISRDSSIHKNSSTQQQVKEIQQIFYKGENFLDLDKREQKIRDETQFDLMDDDDDQALSSKLKSVGQFNYHFKAGLSDY